MNNHLIVHKTLKWELMIRWSQCNDVTMSMMLKISVWWSTIWSLCGDNDNHFHPGIIIEMLTTFCLRSSNHPGITSDRWRFHGESTVILDDDDDENDDVKGSDYFSIMTCCQQWLNKAQGRQIQWWQGYNNDKDIDDGGHGDEDDEHYNNDVGQLPWQTMLKSAQGGSFQLLDCPISPI